MAATRLIPLHINKGKTVAQCLADRTDYSENAAKTNDGEFISSYMCDPKSCDQEFLLSKREYLHKVGHESQNEIIAYQIRQSFKPGEVSPEEANKIGYELAESWTKGKHAFIVATHVDRAHIHNHIIYNFTNLECNRKYYFPENHFAVKGRKQEFLYYKDIDYTWLYSIVKTFNFCSYLIMYKEIMETDIDENELKYIE